MRLAICIAAGLTAAASAAGQASPDNDLPVVVPAWDSSGYRPMDAPVEFMLSRPLTAADGRIAVLVGRADLSSAARLAGDRLTVPLRGERLPAGELVVEAWLVRPDGTWTPAARAGLKRLTKGGFESASIVPKLDVQSDGQLGASDDVTAAAPRGATYQDFTGSAGIEAGARRNGWSATWQGIALGASHAPARLRAAQMGTGAPVIDLASYTVRLSRGPVAMTGGHLSLGTHRLLASQVRTRGVAADLALGPVSLNIGAAAANEVVGWSDPLGLTRPSHRLTTAAVALDLVRSRPGAVRVEASVLDGSRQPMPAFTQQSVTDREASRGIGAQIVLADPSQRLRASLGWASSRFTNPADPLLAFDTVLVPVREERRAARFAEMAFDAVRARRFGPVPVTLSLSVRHERTDPLYRSIAAFVQADRNQNSVDATGSLGALQWQGSAGWARDNLDEVPSLLITRTRSYGMSAALPIASLVRAPATSWWWPALTAAWQGVVQRGDSIPPNGGFRDATQLPDQYAGSAQIGVAWQTGAWNAAYRLSRSLIDNRQPGRERADFVTAAHGVTLGWTASPRLGLALDASTERQRNVELAARAESHRVGMQADWRPFGTTALLGAASLAATRDEAATQRARNVEVRIELSQGITFRRGLPDEPRGRLFLRWARTGAALRIGGAVQPDFVSWTMNGGLSLRLL